MALLDEYTFLSPFKKPIYLIKSIGNHNEAGLRQHTDSGLE
jgi:hypothetical protein